MKKTLKLLKKLQTLENRQHSWLPFYVWLELFSDLSGRVCFENGEKVRFESPKAANRVLREKIKALKSRR